MRHAFYSAVIMKFMHCGTFAACLLLFASVQSQSISGYFYLSTYVFNVFPNANFSAFVLFENERVSRLNYGEYRRINASFQAYSDFIIQYRELYTDFVRSDFTDFGFMESDLSPNMEVIMLLSRHSGDPSKPKHNLLVFDQSTIPPDSSKLYLYNAMYNRISNNQGLYFYGLYHRKNTDGSESESITQLAVDLPRNSGIDVNIQPGTHTTIKAFYSSVNSVLSFKNTPAIVEISFTAGDERQRRYLIAHGDFMEYNSTKITRPKLVQLYVASSSITVNPYNVITILCTVMSGLLTTNRI